MITNLSIGRYGRFGNMLFQIAAVIGIARRCGQEYGFLPPVNWDHKERFGSDEPVELEPFFENIFPRLDKDARQFHGRSYQFGYHDIYLPAGDWDIQGHFQSDKFFSDHIDEVRRVLKMRNEPVLQDLVAVHVRRGDYDDVYHPRLKDDYYSRAIAKFPSGTKFMVFSDDPDDAFEMFKRIGPVNAPGSQFFLSTQNGYLGDFRLMKCCRHFITGNSSFSLMAAILGNGPDKRIICPKNWFGPAWGVKMPTRDIYPQNSIVI